MKNIIFLWGLFLLFQHQIQAQGGLLLAGGAHLVCDGAVSIVLENGKFKNNASSFVRGSSTVKFTGNASSSVSVIEGSGFAFHNLEIAKSSNNVRLLPSSITVFNQLVFTSGHLDLNGKKVILGNTANDAQLVKESEDSHTFSPNTFSQVTKTWSINNPTNYQFGNMGLRMTATGNFGNTTIERLHAPQTLPTGQSIHKYWRIKTANNPTGQNALLRFYYFEDEHDVPLGPDESVLTIWHSTDKGVTWIDRGFSVRSATVNYVQQGGIDNINGWWTLGEAISLHKPGEERSDRPAIISEAVWSISPNPVMDIACVKITADKAETISIELYSADGKRVLQSAQTLQKGENNCSLNLQNLTPGIYFARIAGRPFEPITVIKTQ
jgi:hypothetical protein